MREYELTIVIQPEISEEGSQSILERLDGVLADSSARRLLCEDLGKRKLAYEVKRFQKGHYHLLSFLDQGQVVKELERILRIEESVLRFLTVKVQDQVADVEALVAESLERETELKKRAAEKAAREVEEAAARADAERAAAEQAEQVARKEGSSPAEAEGSSPAKAEGSSPAEAEGSSPAKAEGSSPAKAEGSSPAKAEGSSPAKAEGSSPAEAEGSSPAKSSPTESAEAVADDGAGGEDQS